jgi:hypothetical protein
MPLRMHTLVRRTLIAALALIVIGSGATAEATFPGVNGPIAFRQFDPATEQFPLLRALPDGTQVTELSDRRASPPTGERTAGASRSTSSSLTETSRSPR